MIELHINSSLCGCQKNFINLRCYLIEKMKQVKQFRRKKYLIIKKVDPQFSMKLVISICSFPKMVLNSRVAKPYFAPCMCCQIYVSLSQLQDAIRSGTLRYGVPTRNSTPIPSSTGNRNFTRVGSIR